MRKVAVIGGGNVGATAAWQLASRDLADVALYDILPGVPAGKALDMTEAGAVVHFDARVEGSDRIDVIRGAEVVIVTAGFPRKPGMDRMDLLKKNVEIARAAAQGIRQHAPDAVVVVVTNPLDVMTWVVKEVTGFPRARVVGMAGVLDAARFAAFVAMELKCSPKDVRPMILGGHGDTMVPLARFSTVHGVPIGDLLPADAVARLADRARNGGAEIVKLLGTGSAYYAPAASAVAMTEAILGDTGRILPSSAYLDGEYGHRDIYLGVPVALGASGVRRIVELPLDAAEKAALAKSADSVRTGIAECRPLIAG
jgi:malate dehydrogenase